MIIDCESCDVRPLACGDCVVGVLLGVPGTEGTSVVQLDVSERRALDVLADQGLVPRLRLVAREERPGMLLVRCGFAERERLLASGTRAFSVTPPMEAHMKVLVDLAEVTPEQLENVLGAAADLQRAAP